MVVLASGEGTNLQALIDGPVAEGAARLVGVASDKPDAPALARGEAAGAAVSAFPLTDYADRAERDAAIGDWIEARGAELVVLAGYMQLLDSTLVNRLSGRIINVHPSLLPAFAGLDAIGQALDYGVAVTGVTVHFVDEGVDTGPVLLQRPVAVPDGRDRATLERAVHEAEHELLPEAVRLIASGRVRVSANGDGRGRVSILPG